MADEPIDADEAPETDPSEEVPDVAEDEAGAEPPKAAPTVVRRKVVSKRVTPKGGGPAVSSGPATKATVAAAEARAKSRKHKDDDEEITFNDRYVSPNANAQLPSPWWVPALMFALIIVGALIIMLNYMNLFGDPENYRLLIGLGFILGGIIVATQYR